MFDEHDAIVDDDADQQQQADGCGPVEIGSGQVEGPPGSRESERQGDHQRDGSLYRFEEAGHDREDKDQCQDEALGEFPVTLLFLFCLFVEVPGVARGKLDIGQGLLDSLCIILGRLSFLIVASDPDTRQAIFAFDAVASAAPVDIGNGGDGDLLASR